jgi:hypothetical protein
MNDTGLSYEFSVNILQKPAFFHQCKKMQLSGSKKSVTISKILWRV